MMIAPGIHPILKIPKNDLSKECIARTTPIIDRIVPIINDVLMSSTTRTVA